MKKINKLLLILLISLNLFSCAKDKNKNLSAEATYIQAMKSLKEKSYAEAAEKFDKMDDDFPLSKWAIKGKVMAAYSFYRDKKYDEVIRVAEEFIRANPANPDVAYVQYLKSLSYYDLIPNIQRAQNGTQLASYSFRELIARFPDSVYAADARKKLINVDEHLAGAKMSVGRYGIKTANYIGAIENFNEVISRYKNTNQAPEAYYRLAEIYYKLGMKDEAEKSIENLKNLYPENAWNLKLKKMK